jgi:hypothetical protein
VGHTGNGCAYRARVWNLRELDHHSPNLGDWDLDDHCTNPGDWDLDDHCTNPRTNPGDWDLDLDDYTVPRQETRIDNWHATWLDGEGGCPFLLPMHTTLCNRVRSHHSLASRQYSALGIEDPDMVSNHCLPHFLVTSSPANVNATIIMVHTHHSAVTRAIFGDT